VSNGKRNAYVYSSSEAALAALGQEGAASGDGYERDGSRSEFLSMTINRAWNNNFIMNVIESSALPIRFTTYKTKD